VAIQTCQVQLKYSILSLSVNPVAYFGGCGNIGQCGLR